MKIFGHSVILTFRFCCQAEQSPENMASNKDNSAAGSPQASTGGSPHDLSTGGTGTQQLPTIDAEKKVDNDVSPVSTVGAETLALDFWDTQGDNLTDTLAHNPPREVLLAYTDFLLSQNVEATECSCEHVPVCGRWQKWTCYYCKFNSSHSTPY